MGKHRKVFLQGNYFFEVDSDRRTLVLNYLRGQKPEYRVFQSGELEQIIIDRSYQRGPIETLIRSIQTSLEHGGAIIADVLLVRRANGTLSCPDGGQRITACIRAGKPCPAKIIPGRPNDPKFEADLFILLNIKTGVTTEQKVHADTGIFAGYIRGLHGDPHSIVYNKINFGQNGRAQLNSSALTKACACVLSPKNKQAHNGKIEKSLGRCEVSFRKNPTVCKNKVANFTRLLLDVFPKKRIKSNVMIGFGRACAQKWKEKIVYPSPVTLRKLMKFDWDKFVAYKTDISSMSPAVEEKIRMLWK